MKDGLEPRFCRAGKPFDGKSSVIFGDDDITEQGAYRTIDDKDVVGEYSCAHHGIPARPDTIGRRFMRGEQFIEIQWILPAVASRRRKAASYFLEKEWNINMDGDIG